CRSDRKVTCDEAYHWIADDPVHHGIRVLRPTAYGKRDIRGASQAAGRGTAGIRGTKTSCRKARNARKARPKAGGGRDGGLDAGRCGDGHKERAVDCPIPSGQPIRSAKRLQSEDRLSAWARRRL